MPKLDMTLTVNHGVLCNRADVFFVQNVLRNGMMLLQSIMNESLCPGSRTKLRSRPSSLFHTLSAPSFDQTLNYQDTESMPNR